MKTTKKQKEGVLNEDLESKIDLILEQNTEILKLKPTVEKMGVGLENIEHKAVAIEIGQKQMAQDIKEIKADLKETKRDHSQRITHLESQM